MMDAKLFASAFCALCILSLVGTGCLASLLSASCNVFGVTAFVAISVGIGSALTLPEFILCCPRLWASAVLFVGPCSLALLWYLRSLFGPLHGNSQLVNVKNRWDCTWCSYVCLSDPQSMRSEAQSFMFFAVGLLVHVLAAAVFVAWRLRTLETNFKSTLEEQDHEGFASASAQNAGAAKAATAKKPKKLLSHINATFEVCLSLLLIFNILHNTGNWCVINSAALDWRCDIIRWLVSDGGVLHHIRWQLTKSTLLHAVRGWKRLSETDIDEDICIHERDWDLLGPIVDKSRKNGHISFPGAAMSKISGSGWLISPRSFQGWDQKRSLFSLFHSFVQINGVSLQESNQTNCWIGPYDFSAGNLTGGGEVVEICPGVRVGIPQGAIAWLEQEYGVGCVEERVVIKTKTGFHDIGCAIFDDSGIPFADDPETLFFWLSNCASVLVAGGILLHSCITVMRLGGSTRVKVT